MYVCICKAVTERQICKAVSEGAVRMNELRRDLGVCSNCGKCGPRVQGVLRESLGAVRAKVGAMAALAGA